MLHNWETRISIIRDSRLAVAPSRADGQVGLPVVSRSIVSKAGETLNMKLTGMVE